MLARLPPAVVALFAMIGVVSAASSDGCTLTSVCCSQASQNVGRVVR